MTPLAIARTRAEQLSDDPDAFLMAYTAAVQAPRWDLDLELLIDQALVRGQYAKAAGLLEGIAARNAAAGMPLHGTPYWQRLRTGQFTGGETA